MLSGACDGSFTPYGRLVKPVILSACFSLSASLQLLCKILVSCRRCFGMCCALGNSDRQHGKSGRCVRARDAEQIRLLIWPLILQCCSGVLLKVIFTKKYQDRTNIKTSLEEKQTEWLCKNWSHLWSFSCFFNTQ